MLQWKRSADILVSRFVQLARATLQVCGAQQVHMTRLERTTLLETQEHQFSQTWQFRLICWSFMPTENICSALCRFPLVRCSFGS